MAELDCAVIGSGAGGMAAAVALANAGQSVRVFERHYLPGGWCQTFERGGYRFSPGVHYVGKLQPEGRLGEIYRGLGVSGDLEFCELNPDGFDHVVAGQDRFDIPRGRQRYAEALKRRFPKEARGIDGFLTSVARIAGALDGDTSTWSGALSSASLLRWAFFSAKSHIEHFVSDPFLKAVLMSQAGDHGLPPSRCPAPVHSAVIAHYFDGGYYPRGGAQAIPRAFQRALRRRGGSLHLRSEVASILMEKGRAIGVKLADGTEVRAKRVISNADPELTFGKLVRPEALPPALAKRLKRTKYSTSCLSLFLAVDDDLRARGLDSGNLWWYRDADVDAAYREGLTVWEPGAEPAGFFLTVTTLKDPSKWQRGRHTLEMFAFIAPEAFTAGAPDYADKKARYTDGMLRLLERRLPGIREKIVFCELGTPLTVSRYVASARGNLYGTEKSLFQVGPWAYPLRTAIPGLWMCGASTLSHGVLGATTSGLAAAAGILGCKGDDLLTEKGPPVRVYPSEEPQRWPDEIRRVMALA